MNVKENIICAGCPLFVCRVCHTKTGHPHQQWCTLSGEEKRRPDCGSCIYSRIKDRECGHPYRKKDGDAK